VAAVCGGGVRVHKDHRRDAYCNLFPYIPGEINLFVVKPGQRTCWHRHMKQTDRFRVIRGKLRVKLWIQASQIWSFVLDAPEQEIVVLPSFWHGYANETDEDAYLLMYLDQKYNPADEQRLSEDEVPWQAAA
jgi:dTDP-4-dehydrorhamnose 3,5-epimerase-like enzyme